MAIETIAGVDLVAQECETLLLSVSVSVLKHLIDHYKL